MVGWGSLFRTGLGELHSGKDPPTCFHPKPSTHQLKFFSKFPSSRKSSERFRKGLRARRKRQRRGQIARKCKIKLSDQSSAIRGGRFSHFVFAMFFVLVQFENKVLERSCLSIKKHNQSPQVFVSSARKPKAMFSGRQTEMSHFCCRLATWTRTISAMKLS